MSDVDDADTPDEPPPPVECATCECCGLTEECTPGYIERVRELHVGRWICGLCSEGVQDEIRRSGMLISTEEAVTRHATFRSSPPPSDLHGEFISAARQLLRRSLDSPRGSRSMSSSPLREGGGEDRTVGSGFFPAMAS